MEFNRTYEEKFMLRALDLAAQGRYTASPNPRVGALVVSNSAETPVVLGAGYHHRAGTPHAEVIALREAGESARNATLYVTLEPCCHHGRTPPCVDAILEFGVKRVLVAMEDPFPQVAGRGIKRLRSAGVDVKVGVCEDQARELNRFFCSLHKRGRPWVILKMAMSLDGKIATHASDSQWISCEASREIVHDFRAEVDAVLVGSGTAISDRPHLTARPKNLSVEQFSQPKRVILDTSGQLLSQLDCIQDHNAAPIEIITGSDVDIPEGIKPEVTITQLPVNSGHVQPMAVLEHLGKETIASLLIEGGARVSTAFLEAGVVDELLLFIAPIVIGGVAAPTICSGSGVEKVTDALCLRKTTVRQIDRDIFIRGLFSEWP